MAVILRDEFTGVDGAPWNTTNWYNTSSATAPTVDIQSNLGRILVPTGGTGGRYAYAYTSVPASATQEIFFEWQRSSSTNVHSGAELLASGGLTTGNFPRSQNGYRIQCNGGSINSLTLSKAVAGVVTNIATVTVPTSVNISVRFRYDNSNTTIYVKAWTTGTAEPAAWTFSGTDAALTNTGVPLLWAFNGSSSVAGNSVFFNNVAVDDLAVVANTNVTKTTTPGTASALMVEPVYGTTYAANTTATKLVTADEQYRSTGTTILGGETFNIGDTYSALFKVDLSGLPTEAGKIGSAKFRFDASVAGVQFGINSVDAAWTEGAVTPGPGATRIGTGTTVATTDSATYNEIDITSLVKQWVAGTRANNGFALMPISGTNTTQVGARNVTTSGFQQPSMDVGYYVEPANKTVTTTPGTASAVALDPAVMAGKSRSWSATAATASASLSEPVVTATRSLALNADAATAQANAGDAQTATTATVNFTVAAPATAEAAGVSPKVVITQPNALLATLPLTASAEATDATVSLPIAVFVNAVVAEGSLIEPTVTAEDNAVISAGVVGTAKARILPTLEESNDESDPYFHRIKAQSDVDDFWFRMDERSGTVADNRLGTNDGIYVGGPTLGVFGLENRRSVAFDGVDDYVQVTDNNVGSRNGTFEAVFKTADANGSLMYGADEAVTSPAGTFVGATFITEVGIVDGKIAVRFTDGTQFLGTKAVNNDEWHHLAVTWVNTRLQVFLDGKLHFARHLIEGQNIVAIPDTFGVGFKGEIMEVVFHTQNVLTEADAVGNYYAAFGVIPILAEVATASADMGQASKGRGNQKRALALFYATEHDTGLTDANYVDEYNWTGLRTSATLTGMFKVDHYGRSVPFNLGEFKVFPKSVQRDESKGGNAYLGGRYFDEITGEPRYIDLATDIDTSDYDLVFFINLPERLNFANGYGEEPSYLVSLHENLIEGVRKAQDDDGFSIWAPQPEVAIALGVVDRVEAHGFGRESKSHTGQGNALGLYDARGAAIDPWVSPGSTLAPTAFHYFDTHALNKYRVVANVEGFTDLNGWRVTDYFYGRPRDNFDLPFEGWKYEELTAGLQIGMTEFYQQDFYNLAVTAGNFPAYNKRRSVVAVPAANVKAGTVVLREAATHYIDANEVENPFRDYATAIVVEPGDSLGGRPVNGRIFVSFMAGADDNMPELVRQLVPAGREDAAKADFDYSSNRVSKTSVSVATGATSINGQAGSATQAALAELVDDLFKSRSGLVMVVEDEQYPTEKVKRFTLIERAFNWLAKREVVALGDKVIRAGAVKAVATMPEPKVRAERDARINVQPMVALAEIKKPANVSDPDVVIRTLPATATATMTGYGKVIEVAPMTARAELVNNFNAIYAGGEQVVLYLRNAEAILYLKEDA